MVKTNNAQTNSAQTNSEFAIMQRFLPYLWPAEQTQLRIRVVAALALVLLSKGVSLLMPFFYKAIVDRMAEGTPSQDLALIAIGLVAAYALARFGGTLFDNLRNVLFERVGQLATRHLATEVFRHLHDLPLSFHLDRRTGSITRIIERGAKSIDSMLYLLLFNLAPVTLELAAVLIIFATSFGMELVGGTVLMVGLYVWFTYALTRWRTELRRQMVHRDNEASSKALDSLLNFETVKYFNAEALEHQRYDAAFGAYSEAAIKSETSLAWLNVGQAVITSLMMGGAMAWTVFGWSEGRFTPGDVVLVNTLLAQLFRPLDMLGMVYRAVKQGLVDMEAMFRLIDTRPEITDAPDAQVLKVQRGRIRFENISFAYDPRRPILRNLSFEAPPGSRTAIVGPSGAGKSTLARLLYRFYDPDQGQITIDGQNIAEVTQASLRASIGIVPQDTVLFNDSIRFNIGFGRADASEDAIMAAAKAARIHSFIERQPDGYGTIVGERGLKLSGGEKQRVAIARTLLKDPPILILDEATSALDSATEAGIQDALAIVEQGRTSIAIAHRLSTIIDCDQILVMEAGRIVEQGTHASLLAEGGLYAEMWALQAQEEEMEAEAGELAPATGTTN